MINLLWLRIKQHVKIKKIIAIEIIILLLFFILAKGFENYSDDYKDSQKIVVGLDKQDKTIPASMLINNFKNTEHFAELFELKDSKEEHFISDLEAGFIDAAVSMPEGFADALYHFENKPVKLISKTSTPIKNAILEETLSGYSKYVKAVDMACYVYNDIVERKESDSTVIEAYEKGITVNLLYATLNRAMYFEKKPLAQVKLVTSTEYYIIALPFSILAFISLVASFKRIREKNLSIQKRIKISGISTLKQITAEYLAELMFILIIFIPFIIYKIVSTDITSSFKLLISIIIATLFFSSLWKVLTHLLKKRENVLVLGISIAFLNALVSGAIVPYILLNQSIKSLAEYSINFSLCKYTMGITSFSRILVFIALFAILFLIDLREESRA